MENGRPHIYLSNEHTNTHEDEDQEKEIQKKRKFILYAQHTK